MQDNDIKKALENLLFKRKCQIARNGELFITLGDILDYINRLEAENERLKEAYAVYEETSGLKKS